MSPFELKGARKQSNGTARCNGIKAIYRRTLIGKEEVLGAGRLCMVETLRATNGKRKWKDDWNGDYQREERVFIS